MEAKTYQQQIAEARQEMERYAQPGLHRQWMRAYRKHQKVIEAMQAIDTLTGEGRC